MKQFVKAWDKNGSWFEYIWNTFPGLSDEKDKQNFGRPHIRKLIKGQALVSYMTAVKSSAWCSYVSVVRSYWAKQR